MTHDWKLASLDEPGIARLAELIALHARSGDALLLEGDLGAGKTTFARAMIRAALADDDAEVPSPTYTLVQTYAGPRCEIAHYDLYRIADASEVAELGLDEALAKGIVLIEWPGRLWGVPAADTLEIRLADAGGDQRSVTLEARGSWQPRLARAEAMWAFIPDAWRNARLGYLQGDASPRAYARLTDEGRSAILMNAPRMPDGPPIRNGLAYSRIAHLAEDVRPFVAIGRELRRRGIAAPEIIAEDLDQGFLLIEDQGDLPFGRALAEGADQAVLWRAAVDVLVALRAGGPPADMVIAPGTIHRLPGFDQGALAIETELLVDWYWPALYGVPCPADARAAFEAAWSQVFARLLAEPSGWLLRDYHSPNLMWRPERCGLARVGVLDFQDAMSGPWAYDVVSLLQDARLDVPEALERDLLAHYKREAAHIDTGFDPEAFDFAFAALGAQRNTKILGIFARLAKRDGKPQYLAHLPRIWRYLERDLSALDLEGLKGWFDHHIPRSRRAERPAA
ncbi:MAG TPA: tRNA (adenosine(37)-N6)-threonylcarbamoyltransferase complex ATPase subunit type 1 TsaE [Hyphomicrobiaceae bacterium]|nr:tRNA (adenosine(37)-N6)-threonylcarbamoyltransferase complex ATPase subunit type 1 TsaE [Hyphomicrobiaceae bacterium]